MAIPSDVKRHDVGLPTHHMTATASIFIGTDSGATTSKTGGVWQDGSPITTRLAQSATNARLGREVVLTGWLNGVEDFLLANSLHWDQVQGVGLALPGPFLRYGVLGHSANLPPGFEGWDFYSEYCSALERRADRPISLVVGNDGNFGGVAEAHRLQSQSPGSMLMLAPGSGLGCAYIDARGLPLQGDSLAGMEGAHMPAPLHLLGIDPLPCGCGRTWGCVEAYTTISGLEHLLAWKMEAYPDHPLASSPVSAKDKVLSLRALAQQEDALAQDIFDFQAKALGLQVANLTMVLDPKYVVIGGGLMDPEATTATFRERYLRILRDTAMPFMWPVQRNTISILPAALGDLSQAIGAALVAMLSYRG